MSTASFTVERRSSAVTRAIVVVALFVCPCPGKRGMTTFAPFAWSARANGSHCSGAFVSPWTSTTASGVRAPCVKKHEPDAGRIFGPSSARIAANRSRAAAKSGAGAT
jgi:hypothetical protein